MNINNIRSKLFTFQVDGKMTREVMEELADGDILLSTAKGKIDSGICLNKNSIGVCRETEILEIDIIDFCRCDKLLVIRILHNINDIVEKALRRADNFLIASSKYDISYNANDFKPYKLSLPMMCYKEIMFPYINIKQLMKSKDYELCHSWSHLIENFLIVFNSEE